MIKIIRKRKMAHFTVRGNIHLFVFTPEGKEGEQIPPINGLMAIWRWIGSHFHDWIDCNGVASSTKFPTELLEWGRKLSGFWEETPWKDYR